MLALFAAVLIASLLGSLHCAGMCGAFVTIAVALDGRPSSPAALNTAYNLGRLLTYTALGAVSGLVGRAVDLGGTAVGLSRTAMVFSGGFMILFGAVALARACGTRLTLPGVPGAWRRLVSRGHRAAFSLPPVSRAWMIGLLTTLLPCGWLYAFAVTAAGTASPALGAMTMAAFWLGTLPVMISLGVSVRSLSGMVRARLPLATSMVMIAVGLYTIVARTGIGPMDDTMAAIHTGDLDDAVRQVRALDDSVPPCCRQ